MDKGPPDRACSNDRGRLNPLPDGAIPEGPGRADPLKLARRLSPMREEVVSERAAGLLFLVQSGHLGLPFASVA
jgi:hypothetical protein